LKVRQFESEPNSSNSLWTSENTSRHSNKSRVLHTRYVRLGGYIWDGGALPFLTNIKYRSESKPKYLSGFKYINTYQNKWHYTPRKNIGYYMITLIYDVDFWWVHDFYSKRFTFMLQCSSSRETQKRYDITLIWIW